MTVMEVAPEARELEWHEAQPERWARERAELDETGWPYRVTRTRSGIGLLVHYPLDSGGSMRLQVRFRQSFPWVPPDVFDLDGVLRGARHVQGWTGELCLVHYEDWNTATTVAKLLASQVPRLLEANRGGEGSPPPSGLEVLTPEPVVAAVVAAVDAGPAVVVNDWAVPPGVESGALVARFRIDRGRLGGGIVESLHGPGFELRCDLDADQLGMFRIPVVGRWLRDRHYRAGESASATWRRISPRLRPLRLETTGDLARCVPAEDLEIIALLVPDEVGYRSAGESWIFLIRVRAGTGRRRTRILRTHYFSRALLAERTPVAAALAGKSVVVVGVGAVGMPLAQDLAQTGVGRVMLIDRDTVDVRTGTRQAGSLFNLGRPKVELGIDVLRALAPYCEVEGITGSLERLWDPAKDDASQATLDRVRRRLATADLVIDAAASLPITRLLSEVRRAVGRPLLVASGTAGGWGGVVSLHTSQTGCWACVEHFREDRSLPVPPEDTEGGFVVPARCSEITYTGARHASQIIAMHGSAVAIAHLAGQQMQGGDYHVASMRSPAGDPAPVSWTSVPLPRHPACPLHREPPQPSSGPGVCGADTSSAEQSPQQMAGGR